MRLLVSLVFMSIALAQSPAERAPANAVSLFSPFAFGYETRIDTNLFGSLWLTGSEVSGKLRYPFESFWVVEPYGFGVLYYDVFYTKHISAVAGVGLEMPWAFWQVTPPNRPQGIYVNLEVGWGLPLSVAPNSTSPHYGPHISSGWTYRFNW